MNRYRGDGSPYGTRPRRAGGPVTVVVHGVDDVRANLGLPPGQAPMASAVMTRPQDWHERAREILWLELARPALRR